MLKRMILATLACTLLVSTPLPVCAAGWQKIDAPQLKEMMDTGNPLVVFPLSRIEYNNLHIVDSVNIPLAQLEEKLPADKGRPLVFYCLGVKCTASPEAADKAVQLGYRNVYAFIEGLPGWIKQGYPTATIERLPLTSIRTLDPRQLKEQLEAQEKTVLIDIRQKHDIAKGRIDHPRTVTIPLDDLIERIDEIPRDAELVVCCEKGKRGPTAVRYLASKGYTDVSCLQGGVKGWADAGLPMKR